MSFDDKKRIEEEPINDNPLQSFEEVSHNEEKTSKKRKITKRTRNLILTSALAVMLAAVLLLITLLPHSGTDGSGSSSIPPQDTTITLLDKTNKNAVTVHRVEISNKEDTFTVAYNATEKVMQIVGYEDIALNDELTETLIAYTELITAMDQVTAPGPLKDYGLDKPQAKATITYADQSSVTLSVGNATPSEDGFYTQISGDENVYIFASDCVYLFMVRSASLADTTLLTTPTVKKDDANGTAVLKEVVYSGKNHPTPLKLRRSYYTDSEEMTLFSYIISEPYTRGTTDAVSGLLGNFKALNASQALYLHPTNAQKQKLGFDNPITVMKVTMAVETSEDNTSADSSTNTVQAEKKIYYNSYTTTITVGSIDSSSNYVVMVEGIDAIFLVDYAALSALADRTYTNSVNQLLFLKNIGELGRISITSNGKQRDFLLTHYPNIEDNDKNMTVTVDGKSYPTADFRELYQMLMGLERFGTTTESYEKDAVLKVDIYTTEGDHYLGASYYPLSGSLCAVETTEGEVFTTRWHNVTHFAEQIENYLNGKKVLILT